MTQRRTSREQLLSTSGLCFTGALVLGAILLAEPGTLDTSRAWISYAILAALLALVGWMGWRRLGRVDGDGAPWLHPVVLLTGYVLFLVVIPGFFLYFFPAFFGIQGGLRYDYFSWGMALMLGGMISLWGGYLAGWSAVRPLGAFADLGRVPIVLPVVLMLYGVTLLVRVFRLAVGGVAYSAHATGAGFGGGLDQWLSYLETARYLVLVLVALQAFRGHWPRWVLLSVLGIEVVYAFSSGFMKPMFWISVVTLVCAVYAGVPLRKYSRYLLVLGLLAVLIVPVAQGLRQGILRYGLDTRSPGAALQSTWRVMESTWGVGTGVGMAMFMEKVPGRFAFVAYMPGLMMSRTPSYVPFLGYDEFAQVPLLILPRVIWPDKPSFSRGRWFSVNYLDMAVDSNSSTALTIFGESYLFAGWTTTVLALFAIGFLLAAIYRNTVPVGLAALYIAMLPGIIDVEMEFTAKFVSLIQGTIFMFAIYLALASVSWLLWKPGVEARRSTALGGRYGTQGS